MAASFTPEMIAYYKAHADDTLQPNLIASGAVGLVIAYTAVTARLFARKASGPRFGWDDWLIIASLAPLSGYAVCMFYGVSVGDGRHMLYLTDPAGYIIAFLVEIILYSVTIALIKISILLFYHRIFPSRTLFKLSCILGAIIIAYNVANILVTTLQCIPLQDLWTTWSTQGHCIDNAIPYAIISIVNLITDFLILLLPVKYVWQLQMRTTRKVQILFMFFLGAIVCVFGVVRVWSVATVSAVDYSWNEVYPEIWSFIEISTGVLAACLPTLGMLIKKRKTPSQQTYSHTPLKENKWAKMRGSGAINHSGSDGRLSAWSKSYGVLSGASQDRGTEPMPTATHHFEMVEEDARHSGESQDLGQTHV